MTEREQLEKMVNEAVAKLSEHCDAVRVFVSKHSCDGATDETTGFTEGRGNVHAQLGVVHEWMDEQQQHQRNRANGPDES